MLQVKLYPKKEDSCRNLSKEELIAVTASNEEGKSSELAVKNKFEKITEISKINLQLLKFQLKTLSHIYKITSLKGDEDEEG